MPVFQLDERLVFPKPELAEEDGLLAVGGDLSPERLLLAYRHGIFPWYSEGDPILWWCPAPRMVLYPEELHISKSMRKVLRHRDFTITFDTDFDSVIEACKDIPRPGQEGTWITPDMLQAYKQLHQLGYAHSVEARKGGRLVGGLYGIAIGQCFFGESMFAWESNASKAAFITLVQWLQQQGFQLIDCQVYTQHLASLGAREISREQFSSALTKSVNNDTLKGPWHYSSPGT